MQEQAECERGFVLPYEHVSENRLEQWANAREDSHDQCDD